MLLKTILQCFLPKIKPEKVEGDEETEKPERTEDGHFIPDPERFPEGMKPLGDYIHS